MNIDDGLSAYVLKIMRKKVVEKAELYGFRVCYRHAALKTDERNSAFLFDMLVDPSTGLEVGQDVVISLKQGLGPVLWGMEFFGESLSEKKMESEEQRHLDFIDNVFRLVGFIEVPCRIGKLNLKLLYCVLVRYIDPAPNKGGTIEVDKNGKVLLFWAGSLCQAKL